MCEEVYFSEKFREVLVKFCYQLLLAKQDFFCLNIFSIESLQFLPFGPEVGAKMADILLKVLKRRPVGTGIFFAQYILNLSMFK